MKRTTATGSVAGTYVDRNLLQEEMCHIVEQLGVTLDGGDSHQLVKAIIGLSHSVGETVWNDLKKTPSEYFPAVPRNIDQDIDAAMYPLLVAEYRAEKADILGTTDFSCTVSGSDVTFPATAAGIAATALIVNDAIVSGWLNGGEDAGDDVADWATVSTRRCLNVAGTDYAIIGGVSATRVFTLSSAPPAGTQTVFIPTYRIPGSTTTVRLHKLTGFVGVVAGDAKGEVVAGWRKMDRGQGHRHDAQYAVAFTNQSFAAGSNAIVLQGAASSPDTEFAYSITTDTINGTPRTGRTTDPRTIGQYAYTWAAVYLP